MSTSIARLGLRCEPSHAACERVPRCALGPEGGEGSGNFLCVPGKHPAAHSRVGLVPTAGVGPVFLGWVRLEPFLPCEPSQWASAHRAQTRIVRVGAHPYGPLCTGTPLCAGGLPPTGVDHMEAIASACAVAHRMCAPSHILVHMASHILLRNP